MLYKRALSRHAVSVRLFVCLCVCHVHGLFENEWTYLQFFSHQMWWQYSDGNPVMWASNAGWVGSKLDSQRISGSVIGYCCAVVNLSNFAAAFLLTAGIGRPSAVSCHGTVTVYSARRTKRGLALYIVTVVREACVWQQGPTLYAEDNRTESNCTHW